MQPPIVKTELVAVCTNRLKFNLMTASLDDLIHFVRKEQNQNVIKHVIKSTNVMNEQEHETK